MNTNKMFEEKNWREDLAELLSSLQFAFYGSILGMNKSQIIEDLKGDFHLVAIAEDSGCEGCYCEVARVEGSKAYRYCFNKYFGGELGDDMNDRQTAAEAARRINEFFPHAALVHTLPNYPKEKKNEQAN